MTTAPVQAPVIGQWHQHIWILRESVDPDGVVGETRFECDSCGVPHS